MITSEMMTEPRVPRINIERDTPGNSRSRDSSSERESCIMMPSVYRDNNAVISPNHSSLRRQSSIGNQLAVVGNNRHGSQMMMTRSNSLLHELLSTRRPSAIIATIQSRRFPNNTMGSLNELEGGSVKTLSVNDDYEYEADMNCAAESKRKNRRVGDDAFSAALSAVYCKVIVILGVALPISKILSSQINDAVYQGFYVYLYIGSLGFVAFTYICQMRSRVVFSLIRTFAERTSGPSEKRRQPHFGSFYLRFGALAFGIGTMVYSGIELGQYIEMRGTSPGCSDIFLALRASGRMAVCIIQMKFIFLNTMELNLERHKVISRFGVMHMIATNLCEWLYILVEETRHEIHHFSHSSHLTKDDVTKVVAQMINNMTTSHSSESSESTELFDSSTTEVMASMKLTENVCARTNIMGNLVQNVAPFLFPCTIEYSLICAVILYEMWKKVKDIPHIARSRKNSIKYTQKRAHQFSVDCGRAHRGMFVGILIIVTTIISMIMYFVLYEQPQYRYSAIMEVTIYEIILYTMTGAAVIFAMIKMRDLKYLQKKPNDHHASSVALDCTLLVLAQTGAYMYGMFSIIGHCFGDQHEVEGQAEALWAEIFCLIQTSLQTLFILNACWRRCKGALQNRLKPGREYITFLIVANMCLWFINTFIKGRAAFRPSHLNFYGEWAWTVITHVSMPLAIFYRFHSTICLFDIWKSAYKAKKGH